MSDSTPYAKALAKLIEEGHALPPHPPRKKKVEATSKEVPEGTLVIGETVPVVPESEPGRSSLDALYDLPDPHRPGSKGDRRPKAIVTLSINMKEYERIILKSFSRKLGLSFSDWVRRVLLREVKLALDSQRIVVPPIVIFKDGEEELMSIVVRGPH